MRHDAGNLFGGAVGLRSSTTPIPTVVGIRVKSTRTVSTLAYLRYGGLLMTERAAYQVQVLNMKSNNLHVQGPRQRVDRATGWGNPFVVVDASERQRQIVCDLFEKYAAWRLTVQPAWLEPLRGKHLECWCAPKRCHAETLRRLAND